MKQLTPHGDLERFFAEANSASQRLLILDYDGTLAPFRQQRDEAVPYPGVRQLVADILASDRSRVVIVSGRWSRDLIALLNIDPYPEIWGCHGAERARPDKEPVVVPLDPRALAGLAQANRWAARRKLSDHCEQKPNSLAIHWRGLHTQQRAELEAEAQSGFESLAGRYPLTVRPFDGGLELVAGEITKGAAVSTLLAETSSNASAAFLGDDLTDENGFEALGERGMSVLVRPEFRPTAADLWLEPPDELIAFLTRWRDLS